MLPFYSQCVKVISFGNKKMHGSKNKSAASQAAGLAKHTPTNPKSLEITKATKHLANISNTPAIMAAGENPMPCMVNRTVNTKVSKGKNPVETKL